MSGVHVIALLSALTTLTVLTKKKLYTDAFFGLYSHSLIFSWYLL